MYTHYHALAENIAAAWIEFGHAVGSSVRKVAGRS